MENSEDLSETNPNDQYGLPSPTRAYGLASASPVYRLSEQMFSSLLASYVLGFIGFVAANSDQPVKEILIRLVIYTSISVSYAYLTASFYLTYHAGILTMPSMPVKRLGFDFALALAQAFFFGFSMVFPKSFPILLGVLIAATLYRQSREYRHLVMRFQNRIPRSAVDEHGPRDLDQELRDLRGKVSKLLKNYPELSGWKPAKKRVKHFSWILIVVGSLVWYFVDLRSLPDNLQVPGTWKFAEWSIAIESGIVALMICLVGRLILRDRASFFYDRTEKTSNMDRQFDLLVEELRKS